MTHNKINTRCSGIKNTLLWPVIVALGLGLFLGCDLVSKLRIDPQDSLITVDRQNMHDYTTLTGSAGQMYLFIHPGVHKIADGTFRDMGLSQVSLPDSLIGIGQYAFAGNSLTELNLPSSLISLQEGAFAQNSIARVGIPETFAEELRFGSGIFSANPAAITAVVEQFTSADKGGRNAERLIARLESRDCIAYQLFPVDTQFQLRRSGESTDIRRVCVLAAPTVNIASVATTSIALQWTEIPGASDYEISWGTDSQGTNGYGSPSLVSGNSQTIDFLALSTLYYVKVRANGRDRYQSSAYHTPLSVTTGTVLLATPTVALDTVTDSSITVAWPAIPDASDYELLWGRDRQATDGGRQVLTGNGATRYTIEGLPAHVPYFLKVRATTNRAGYQSGNYSPPLPAETGKIMLAAPAVNATAVTDSSLTVIWAATPGALGYELSWGTNSRASGGIGSPATVSGRSYTIDGLQPYTLYSVKVKAIGRGSYQSGNYSRSVRSRTAKTVLKTPDSLAVDTVTTSSLTVSWTSVLAASHYELSWGTDSRASGGIGSPYTASGTHYTIVGLQAATRIYIKVRALGGGQYEASPFGQISQQTEEPPRLSAPTGLSGTRSSATVSWSAVLGAAAGYIVSWGTNTDAIGGGTIEVAPGTTSQSIIHSAADSQTLYVKVKAKEAPSIPYRESVWSSVFGLLATPQNLRLSNYSSGIKVEWDALAEAAAGYTISWGPNSNADGATTDIPVGTSHTISSVGPRHWYVKIKAKQAPGFAESSWSPVKLIVISA